MGLGRCIHCGEELINDRATGDRAYRHYHPNVPEGRFFCEYMQEELGRAAPGLRGRRGTPPPEEDIVDKILNKYYESTCK